MKPRLYKRFGRWNLKEGDKVTTIWSDLVGDGLDIDTAMRYFQARLAR